MVCFDNVESNQCSGTLIDVSFDMDLNVPSVRDGYENTKGCSSCKVLSRRRRKNCNRFNCVCYFAITLYRRLLQIGVCTEGSQASTL